MTAQGRPHRLAVDVHLVARDLHPVQPRLAPLHDDVTCVLLSEPDLRPVGRPGDEDLYVLDAGGRRSIAVVLGLHKHIVDRSAMGK